MTSDKWDFTAMLREFPHANPPASLASIRQVEKEYGRPLPSDYVQFLLCANGGCGRIGAEGYIDLWRVEDLLATNKAYEFDLDGPGLLVFGSDGGGESFAFDARGGRMLITMVPFIGDRRVDAMPVARDFYSFLRMYPDWDFKQPQI